MLILFYMLNIQKLDLKSDKTKIIQYKNTLYFGIDKVFK